MKIRVGMDEWWLLCDKGDDTDDSYYGVVDVPEDLVIAWRQAVTLFDAAQTAVVAHLEATGQEYD